MYIFPSTGVGSEDKSDVDYVYKKVIKHKIYIKVMFNLLFAKKNHSKVISFLQLWEGEDAGVGLTDPLGISFSNSSFRRRNPTSGGMGRFLDKSGIYADDIVEGMMVKVMMVKMMIIMVGIIMMMVIIKVRQLRIANFINNVVAKRERCDRSDYILRLFLHAIQSCS